MSLSTKSGFLSMILAVTVMSLLSSCKKDEQSVASNVDVDGNVYSSVTIYGQVWMLENLMTTRYRNGDSIHQVSSDAEWSTHEKGAWCNYGNDEANVGTYGRLYNWHAVHDSRKICPAGWHVPTEDDWALLLLNLGELHEAGGKLKESGTAHWQSPNTAATNETGFTGLPSGLRHTDGTFAGKGIVTSWWSATEFDTWGEWAKGLSYDSSGIINHHGYFILEKNSGRSVRCVRDF